MKNAQLIQLIIAAILSIGGLALLYVGAWFAPQGEIHETILIAFGEVATFAGSIIGIDYHYKSKYHDNHPNKNTPAGQSSPRNDDL
ncbi:MAG: hypothetical protein IKM83_00125 [Paludibacteraceae bacterium]|nr:hypothetical protein [Paludibacteraceae bacterium]